MSRKHCRRKIYALVNPIALAIEGAAITDTALLDRLRLLELSALDGFKKGTPTLSDWRSMADVSNIAETMARDGIGPEVLEVCKRAQEALSAGHERYQTHGTIGRVAGEYETLADLWQFHDLQRSSVSRSEYERAIKKTADRIRSLHPSVRVCIA
jgi:hypothetical protein